MTVKSKTNNRAPSVGMMDATGKFSTDEVSQIEAFIRVGCVAMQQGKPLEESQNFGATALHLIQRLKEISGPQPEVTE